MTKLGQVAFLKFQSEILQMVEIKDPESYQNIPSLQCFQLHEMSFIFNYSTFKKILVCIINLLLLLNLSLLKYYISGVPYESVPPLSFTKKVICDLSLFRK